jgi:tetratricopeptide (TPR) repeat protein
MVHQGQCAGPRFFGMSKVMVALRSPRTRSFRARMLGIGVAALLCALSPGAARAQQEATLKGEEERNFGRLVFTLPSSQPVSARVTNGVLIVGFSEPVRLTADRILREMPSYVSAVRVDPDGRGVRFALTRAFTSNMIEAGERVFVDLLPQNWQGLKPSLPPEVMKEMVDRLRQAELIARELVRNRERTEGPEIAVRGATLPTLSRLVFEVPQEMNVEARAEGDALTVAFRAPARLAVGQVRSLLPPGASVDAIERSADGIVMRLRVDPQLEPRTFREEDGFIIDLVDRAKSAAAAKAAEAQLAARVAEAEAAARPTAPPAAAPAAAPVAAPAATPAAKAARDASAEAPPKPAGAAPADPPAAPAWQTAGPAAPPQSVGIAVTQAPDGARIDFAFPRRTAAAAFDDRGETVVVFDTIDTLDARQLMAEAGAHIVSAAATREGKATVLRLQMKPGGIVRLAPDGLRWSLTLGDKGVQAAEPLLARRSFDERGQSVISLPLTQVSSVHWIGTEPGQSVAVATAYGPGASTPKVQRFVEFQIEQTVQGVAVRPVADDVMVRVGVGEVIIGRGSGLAVSAGHDKPQVPGSDEAGSNLVADQASWTDMRKGDTYAQLQELMRKAADAPRSERSVARLKLATFQLANGLHAESLGPVATVLADDPNMRNDRRAHLLRAIALTLLDRGEAAEKTLSASFLKDDAEAHIWLAVNDARLGRFPRALSSFRRSMDVLDAYPDMLQAVVRREIVNAAIAMRDVSVADRELTLLAALAPHWTPQDEVELLRAQLDEISGRPEAALAGYRALFNSNRRPVAASAQLRAVQLAAREGDASMSVDEARARLETVAFIWRGGDTEIEAMGELGAIYAVQQKWREAFALARKANGVFPDHPITRKLHDDTARQFEELFTNGKANQLPRIDALALFYDFREFMPIGRRGDEIIRRLSDRLVEVDLLDQAAELLQHQIDNRLTGGARATVAARLAMVQLMNGKPAEALRSLSTTRLAELPRDVKRARQLLEAKALSDLSRTDLALEVLENERGPEVDRLRADILWIARRWREAGEAHERLLGEAWRQPAPLDERQRADTMRAAVAYVMASEGLSLDRLRAKYANAMSQTPDARTFAFVTGANRSRSGDLRELARTVANADTLMEFMTEYRKRYPDYASSLRTRPAQPAARPDAAAEPPSGAPAPEAAAPGPAPRQG